MNRALTLAAALCAASCFEPWSVAGPYRCGMGACPEGMLCDDGVCCFPDKAPVCRALVLDGGTCASGATAQMYYEDLDGDTFGNPRAGKLYCARPVSDPYVEDQTDCDDSAAEANPKGQERCDGLDNDCDGQPDEGLTPQKTFFRDQDGDGAGDPAKPFTACAPPPGYVESNNDCGPDQFARHPGAPELCNGLDDDCDSVTDEAPTDIGQACLDGGFGQCGPGTTACSGGKLVCASTTGPSADVCDGEDNNCNGVTDEQPECGGPRYLLGPGVSTGAQNLRTVVGFPPPPSCLKDYGTAEVPDSWSAPVWAGTSSNTHVWWAEAPAGRTWDLSKPGTFLHLQLAYTLLNGEPTGDPWSDGNWPVVYLCDPTGTQFNRYVPAGATGLLGPTASGSVNSVMPIAGGNGWTVGVGSGFDIKRVKRVEITLKPDLTTTVPSFTVTFRSDAGFVAP